MIIALIDNGSLEPAAHRNLRAVAEALSLRSNNKVFPVSWKHSDRVAPAALDDSPAWTLGSFIRSMVALGQREFVFVPFFISPQGAIGSALRRDLEELQREAGPFQFSFTAGLAERGIVARIVADRIRKTIAAKSLRRPAAVVVDHGGPSSASARLRDELADEVRAMLGGEISALGAASMEGTHPPLLADLLREPRFATQNVVVAPMFLSPGRHAGPEGDLATIAREAHPACHFAELVGTHPLAIDALAAALHDCPAPVHAQPSFA